MGIDKRMQEKPLFLSTRIGDGKSSSPLVGRPNSCSESKGWFYLLAAAAAAAAAKPWTIPGSALQLGHWWPLESAHSIGSSEAMCLPGLTRGLRRSKPSNYCFPHKIAQKEQTAPESTFCPPQHHQGLSRKKECKKNEANQNGTARAQKTQLSWELNPTELGTNRPSKPKQGWMLSKIENLQKNRVF